MKKKFYKGLQFNILLIVSIAIVPFIVLSVYNASEAREHEREDLKRKAIQLVNFTLMEEAQTIDATRQLLISLSTLPEQYFSNSGLSNNYLSELLKRYSRYLDFGILDKNGKLFSNSRKNHESKDFSTYEFFIEIKKYKEFSIGGYLIDSLTNKRVIHLGFPVFDNQRNIKAVIFALLDVSLLEIFEKELVKIFSERSLFIKVEEDGEILSTNLKSNKQIETILNQSILAKIKNQEMGVVEAPGIDNDMYLFLFARTKSNLFKEILYLIVGTPISQFYVDINKTLYRNLFLIAALFVIISAIVLIMTDKYILKTVEKLIKATNEMTAGNYKIRSHVKFGPKEIEHLALNFDHLAESLEKEKFEREFAEKHLRFILNNAPITILAIDKQGKFTLSEGKGLERVNLKPGENVGVSAIELYKNLKVIESNGNITNAKEVIHRVLNGESIRGITELRGVYFDNQFVPIYDINNNVSGMVGAAIDITEKQKAENLLRESEERFRDLFEHSPVSLWLEDHSEIKKYIDQLRAAGINDFRTYFQAHPEEVANCVTMLKVVAVNKATLQLYNAESKEDLLKGLLIIFRKESYAVFTEELIALSIGKTVFECEASTQTLTGEKNYVIFKLSILPGYEETWSKILVSMTDITERKKNEEERSKLFKEIQEAENQSRFLSRRLLETQELERQIISRELHDEIGQTLTAAKINLQSIQNQTKSQKMIQELNTAISYLDQSLQQVRDMSLNLRPSILDDLGIEAALRWLINRFAKGKKIKFDFQYLVGDRILPKDLQLECYRITQEALNNIMKYANAKKVVISLSIINETLHLNIKDNGKGFDVQLAKEQALKGKSLGLLSMEERVKLTGGEFSITSSEKTGTELHAVFYLT